MMNDRNTNSDDFKNSGDWEVFASHQQDKFSQNMESNFSAEEHEKKESIVHSDEMQLIKS